MVHLDRALSKMVYDQARNLKISPLKSFWLHIPQLRYKYLLEMNSYSINNNDSNSIIFQLTNYSSHSVQFNFQDKMKLNTFQARLDFTFLRKFTRKENIEKS